MLLLSLLQYNAFTPQPSIDIYHRARGLLRRRPNADPRLWAMWWPHVLGIYDLRRGVRLSPSVHIAQSWAKTSVARFASGRATVRAPCRTLLASDTSFRRSFLAVRTRDGAAAFWWAD